VRQFKALLYPVTLFQVVDEHVLHSDVAAVDLLQVDENSPVYTQILDSLQLQHLIGIKQKIYGITLYLYLSILCLWIVNWCFANVFDHNYKAYQTATRYGMRSVVCRGSWMPGDNEVLGCPGQGKYP